MSCSAGRRYGQHVARRVVQPCRNGEVPHPADGCFQAYCHWMEWLLFALAGGGVALAARQLWDRKKARREDAADLTQIRKVADEDITLLGEELSQLDAEVAGRQLDVATRRDYQRALDAYESAQFTVKSLKHSEMISTITDTLAT